jgi:NADH-quinone oxidoreductase subunit N
MTFAPVLDHWTVIITAIAVATMTIANILALAQTNIKRLLAYSSISQAGYLLIGISAHSTQGIKAVLFYLVAYAFMNLGVFAVVVLLSRHWQSDNIDDYAGLAKRAPFTAFVLMVSLLSLAGIPPLAGFIGKFYLLAVAVEAKLFVLAVAAVLNSVIALYYYVRVIRVMYFLDPVSSQSISSSFALRLALLIALVGSILFGVWPQPLLALIGQS